MKGISKLGLALLGPPSWPGVKSRIVASSVMGWWFVLFTGTHGCVGRGVGTGVGCGVGTGVGYGVSWGVGYGVGTGVGSGVGSGVGAGVG